MTRARHIVLAATLSAALPALADDSGGKFTVGLGADHSSGKYGGTQSTEIDYYSVFGRYEVGRWTAKLTLPWLRITGPGTVVGGDRPIVIDSGGNAARTSTSGIGDVVGAVTYAAYESRSLLIDVTGKVKIPTASKSEGLGSGKADYTLQTDAYVTLRPGFTVFTGIGYRVFGDPAGTNYENVFQGNVGFSWKVVPKFSTGASFDYRQAVLPGQQPMRELTPFVVWKFTDRTKLQLYAVHGYSKSSVDWGGGAVLMQRF